MPVPADWPYEFKYPIRNQIKRNMTAALREITPANGYVSDLSEAVFRGRVLFGPKDPLPMIAILETPIQPDAMPGAPANPARKGPWDLTIQGFVKDDPENPTDEADFIAADVVMRLAVEKLKGEGRNATYDLFGMPNNVTDIIIGAPVSRPPDELSAYAYFYLPVTLTLVEDLNKPYGEKLT